MEQSLRTFVFFSIDSSNVVPVYANETKSYLKSSKQTILDASLNSSFSSLTVFFDSVSMYVGS